MKKFIFLIFGLIFANTSFADTVKDATSCWECSVVEGMYAYTFNFVFKMYNHLATTVFYIIIIFFLFWFLWFTWEKIIKNSNKLDGKTIATMIFKKIFVMTFALAMLLVKPHIIFQNTIDPIMNIGSGFGKWILQTTKDEQPNIQNVTVPKFNCENIEVSKQIKTMLMPKDVKEGENDETSLDSLKNIICITREYSNTYNSMLYLGFNIITAGFTGIIENKATRAVMANVADGLDFVENFIPEPIIKNIVKGIVIALKIIGILLLGSYFLNIFIVIFGITFVAIFLYVAFYFMTILIDVIIKLALVAVMMPITIGSLAFSGDDMVDLKSKLSSQLFWNVLKVSFRLVALAISTGISMFLFTELLQYDFSNSNNLLYDATPVKDVLESANLHKSGLGTLQILYESFVNPTLASRIFQGVGLSSSTYNLVALLLTPSAVVAILLVNMVAWMLLSESMSIADKLSGSLYSGVNDDNVMTGLRTIVKTSYKFIKSGVTRTITGYIKQENVKKELENINKETENKYNDKVKTVSNFLQNQYKNEVFKNGNLEHIYDLEPETLVDYYDNYRKTGFFEQLAPIEYTVPTKEEAEEENKLFKVPFKPNNILNTENKINKHIKQERNFLDDKFGSFIKYQKFSDKEKDKIVEVLLGDKKDDAILENDKTISYMKNIISKNKENLFKNVSFDNDKITPLELLRLEYINEQIRKITETDNYFISDKPMTQNFINFMITGKNNDGNTEIYNGLYNKWKDDILKSNYKKKKKWQELNLLQKNYEINNKLESKINAKTIVIALKKEELNFLQEEIKNLDPFDFGMKRFLLKRNLKKINNFINDLNNYSIYDAEEIYDETVQNWKRIKKLYQPKINKLKDS